MIRYRKLGHVALNVTDLDRAAAFYAGVVGLEPVGAGTEGERLFRCSADHHSVALHRADHPGLKRLGWMLEDAQQIDRVAAALSDAGVPWRRLAADECAARGLAEAIQIVETATAAVAGENALPPRRARRRRRDPRMRRRRRGLAPAERWPAPTFGPRAPAAVHWPRGARAIGPAPDRSPKRRPNATCCDGVMC